jgi:uncharacterized membrane protein
LGVLVTGIVVWSLVHWFPAAAPAARSRLAGRLGANAWRGLFSLAILVSLVLMIVGWRSSSVEPWYSPPLYGNPLVPLLVLLAFFLFAAANAPGNTKRFLRHPMLAGTILWSLAHLLANGDNRSVVLFGGLGLWALVAILLINRRDRVYSPPPAVPATRDLMTLAGAAVVFAAVALLHRWLFGVSPFPGL